MGKVPDRVENIGEKTSSLALYYVIPNFNYI